MPVTYGYLEPVDLCLDHLPPMLDGLRIAQVSDLHIHRPRPWLQRLADQLTRQRLDLVLFTGDYMHHTRKPGQEDAAMTWLSGLCASLKPRLGCFGVFGNHDTPEFRKQAQALPVRWLTDTHVLLPSSPLMLMGLDTPLGSYEHGDAVPLLSHLGSPPPADNEPPDGASAKQSQPPRPAYLAPLSGHDAPPLRLMLCHMPSAIVPAADLNVDLLFAGHTHGGQIRLPTGHALTNRTGLPLRCSSGILRHRNTLAVVSRGLGNSPYSFRLFCRPHVPVYTLRRQNKLGQASDEVINVRWW